MRQGKRHGIGHGKAALAEAEEAGWIVMPRASTPVATMRSSVGSNGAQYLDFDRDATTLQDAILSAVADVEEVDGVEVVRLADAGLVSMADIASKVGRTSESIRLLATGERGPGGFPPPVNDPRSRYRLWRSSEVLHWFEHSLGEGPLSQDDQVRAAINAGLELRHHRRRLGKGRRTDLRELVGLS